MVKKSSHVQVLSLLFFFSLGKNYHPFFVYFDIAIFTVIFAFIVEEIQSCPSLMLSLLFLSRLNARPRPRVCSGSRLGRD